MPILDKQYLKTTPSGKAPLISIGLASYNRPQLLQRAISSIISQQYPNLEILINDNGSTDPAVKTVIEKFQKIDGRVKAYFEPENKGPFFNFRLLLSKATGAYFIWLADDDYWGDDFLSNLSSVAYHSGAALTYGRAVGAADGPNPSREPPLKEMQTDLNAGTSIISFVLFDSDSIFYGLFKTQEGQKLLSLLTEWSIPKYIHNLYPFLSYNFPSYVFIYGLLAQGGFRNAGVENIVHYVGGRSPYENSNKINIGHFSLILGYMYMHTQMTFRLMKASLLVRSWRGFVFAPFASGYLFFRRISVALINRKNRHQNKN
jgi:GalNAc5-diNAcBac-PP-undecaprenol beta-1,3-glucosyltransferase